MFVEKIRKDEMGKVEAVKEPSEKVKKKTLELEKEVHDMESADEKCDSC